MIFLPIDTHVKDHAVVMQVANSKKPDPPIWEDFQRVLSETEGDWVSLTSIERFSFYDRAKSAFAVAASETALCANLILKKRVVEDDGQEI